MIPTDTEWQPLLTEEGEPAVYQDTLTALIAADPQSEETPRDLPAETYEGAFDGWEIARQHVHAEWTELADGTSLLPEVPKALRRAAELVYKNPGALDAADEEDLFQRLNTSPTARVQRDVREVLASDFPDGEKLRAFHKLLVEVGVQPATPPPDLRPVDLEEIGLVAWMAVQPSAIAVGSGSGPLY